MPQLLAPDYLKAWGGLVTTISTLILFIVYVDRPLERFRKQRVSKVLDAPPFLKNQNNVDSMIVES